MPARTQHAKKPAKKPTARPTPRKQISKVLTFRAGDVVAPDGTGSYVNYKLRALFGLDVPECRLRVTAAPRGRYQLRAVRYEGIWDFTVVDTTTGGDVGKLCAEATCRALHPLTVRSGSRFDIERLRAE